MPYRGISQATNDLVSGQISLVIGVMSDQLKQLAQAGKVRLLAVTSRKAAERRAGDSDRGRIRHAGFRYEGWFGIFAPKDTDDAIIDRIAQATRLAMADPAIQANYRAQGIEPDIDSSPDKFQRIVDADNGKPGARDQVDRAEQFVRPLASTRDVWRPSAVTMRADSATRHISAASSQNAVGNPPSRATKPTPAGPTRMPA